MTVVSVKTGADPQVLKVGLADGSLFFVRTVYLPAGFGADLRVGSELDAGEEEALRFGGACYLTERAALALIARSEQYAAALARKLQKKEHPPESVRLVLSRLRSLELLDDRRYCEFWIRSRLRRAGEGPVRLAAALQAKGIDRRLVQAALADLVDPETEAGLLRRYAEKKRLDLRAPTEVQLVRSRLRRAGFSAAAIRVVLTDE